jgi:SAM-dependent methyltransferase
VSVPALLQATRAFSPEHEGGPAPIAQEQQPAVREQPARARQVSVQEGYRLWAATYDDDPNPLLALEERHLTPLLPSLRSKDMLDAGCGTGRWLRRFASAGAGTTTGVDFSSAMLGQAARCLADCGSGFEPAVHTAPWLIRGDCLALPVRSRTADLVMCSLTIGHLAGIEPLAREFSRVARPGADVFVTDMHPRAQALGWRCGFRCHDGSIEVETWLHTEEEVRESFESAGFSLVEMRTLYIGEPERPIFSRAGKESMFDAACAVPAVLLCHFRLI